MKIVTRYQCEICKREFSTDVAAMNCEGRGKELPLAQKGQKVRYKDEWNGGFGVHWYETVIGNVEDSGHEVEYELGNNYEMDDGELIFHPEEFISGNKEFVEKCQIVK